MDGRIRERLNDLATDAPSGRLVPPIVVRRARRRVARNVTACVLALGLLAVGFAVGVRTLTNSSTLPASKPSSGPTGTTRLSVSSPSVNVPATQAFTDTGIAISQHEVFSVTATGTASYSTGHNVGPQGVGFKKFACTHAQSIAAFTAPGLRCWSLIGRIGTRGVVFYVGPSSHVEAPVAGELFLGFNESFYGDNSGAFTATISQALTNGSFEQPVLPAGTWSTECGTAIPDWVIGGGCVDLSTGGSASGKQWIDLNDSEGAPPGSMTQTLPLSAGTYGLRFAFAGNTSERCGGQGIKTLALLIDGHQIGRWSIDTTGPSLRLAWVKAHKNFTVSSPGQATSIEFLSTTHDNCAGPAIDSVRLVKLG